MFSRSLHSLLPLPSLSLSLSDSRFISFSLPLSLFFRSYKLIYWLYRAIANKTFVLFSNSFMSYAIASRRTGTGTAAQMQDQHSSRFRQRRYKPDGFRNIYTCEIILKSFGKKGTCVGRAVEP